MIKKLIAFAITSGLAAQALKLWMDSEKSRQRKSAANDVPPPEVQRWEDEGGAPPATTGQGTA
jgi:hypothetical protein